MHAMGVPTTRALSLVATGDQVGGYFWGSTREEGGAKSCGLLVPPSTQAAS